MADFSSYLSVDMADVPKTVPSLPGGHYFATVSGWKTAERNYDKATGGPPTPVVEISFRVTSADEDVDTTLLPAGGGAGKILTKDYRLNDPDRTGQVMLRRLAEETCGLPVKGYDLESLLDALKGSEVKVFNVPRPGQEEGQFFPNVTKVLPAQ